MRSPFPGVRTVGVFIQACNNVLGLDLKPRYSKKGESGFCLSPTGRLSSRVWRRSREVVGPHKSMPRRSRSVRQDTRGEWDVPREVGQI